MPVSGLVLESSDGVRLEAEIAEVDGPGAAVVLAHPHPHHGGDMHAGLIASLFDTLPTRGLTTLRFNFRGVGRSGGAHDGGRGERADVAAAVAHLLERHPELPVAVCGWSFGAVVALDVDTTGLAGWVAVAPPLAMLDGRVPAAAADPRPTVLLVPEHDQLCPPSAARRLADGWAATRLVELAGTDHVLWGQAGIVATHVLAAVDELGRS